MSSRTKLEHTFRAWDTLSMVEDLDDPIAALRRGKEWVGAVTAAVAFGEGYRVQLLTRIFDVLHGAELAHRICMVRGLTTLELTPHERCVLVAMVDGMELDPEDQPTARGLMRRLHR